MTPAARVAAAIECLDAIIGGAPAEKTLTTWARRNRYAGSGDRLAIRDHVFDAIRRLRSAAAAGGAMTGRGTMLGLLRQQGAEVAALFDGSRYGPAPVAETEAGREPATRAESLDVQDWCLPHLDHALGNESDQVLSLLRDRAPVFVRANLPRISREDLLGRLADEGISGAVHPLSPSALEITGGARGLVRSVAFAEGLFEVQDAASQAVVDHVADAAKGGEVLDYCAGGGGKSLALAAAGARRVIAHDADAARMGDIGPRAKRAGVMIEVRPKLTEGLTADLVLVDAPCSGSGAWRRQPEAKWRLTQDGLENLTHLQADILHAAATRVRPGGTLAYATCSLFREENADQVATFLARHPGWELVSSRVLTPLDGGDGFYVARLRPPN